MEYAPLAGPHAVFIASGHRPVADTLRHWLQQPGGVAALTGEPGLGKSVLVRHVLAEAGGVGPTLTLIGRTAAVRPAWMKLLSVGVPGRAGVLVVEDAHELPLEQLQQITVLLDRSPQAERPHLLFVAQPRFWPALSEPELAGLREAIGIRAVLFPMTQADALAYVAHLFRLAGVRARRALGRAALQELLLRTAGNPHRITLELAPILAPLLGSAPQQPIAGRPAPAGGARGGRALAAVTTVAAVLLAGAAVLLSDDVPGGPWALFRTGPATALAAAPAAPVEAPLPYAAKISLFEAAAADGVGLDKPQDAGPAAVLPPDPLQAAPEPGQDLLPEPVRADPAPSLASSSLAAPGPAEPAQLPPSLVALLIRRGDEMLGRNDVPTARMLYERAARAGSARAALLLGETFDPTIAPANGADPAAAAAWYAIAVSLGDTRAPARLERIKATEPG